MDHFYKVRLDRVVDGDTVDVHVDLGFDVWIKRRLRLLGIDAPETRTRDLVEKAEGIKVKEWLENRLEEAETKDQDIHIETKKTGKFGRYLATLYVAGVNLNKTMLDLGLAKIYGSYKK